MPARWSARRAGCLTGGGTQARGEVQTSRAAVAAGTPGRNGSITRAISHDRDFIAGASSKASLLAE